MRFKLSWTLKLWKKTWIFNFTLNSRLVPTPTGETVGMGSVTTDGLHQVVFLDYDYITLERLVRELTALQETYMLGNFYIFQSRENSYHAICLDCLTFQEAYEIVHASSCDQAFKHSPHYTRYRDWTLRVFPKGARDKPKFLMKLESPYEGLRKQSMGHALALKYFYGLDIKLINPDSSEKEAEIELRIYKTAVRLKKWIKHQKKAEE